MSSSKPTFWSSKRFSRLRIKAIEAVRIMGIAVAAMLLFGILLDQVAVRLCAEYFAVAHPLLHTTNATVIGLLAGIGSMWWVGLPLGGALATVGFLRPAKSPASLVVLPLLKLLCVMAVSAAAAGAAGFYACRGGLLVVPKNLAGSVPVEHHAFFIGNYCATLATYAACIVGGFKTVVSVANKGYSSGPQATVAPESH